MKRGALASLGLVGLLASTACTSLLGDDFSFDGTAGVGGSGTSGSATAGAPGGAAGSSGGDAGTGGASSGSGGASGSGAGAAGAQAGTAGAQGGGAGVGGNAGAAGAPAGPLHQSGTQLKMRWWEADGGVKRFAAVYDSLLDAECQPTYGHGTGYCVPYATGQIVYTDVDCKTPVVVRQFGGMVPKYVVVSSPGAPCAEAPLKLKKVGAKTTKVPFYEKTGAVCSPAGGPVDQAELYDLGGDVPDADIVTLTEVVENRGALDVVLHVGSDGSRIYKATRLKGSAFEAQVMGISGTKVWVPNGAYMDANQGLFQDAACKALLAYSTDSCAKAAPQYAIEYIEAAGCVSIKVHTVGAEVTSSVYTNAGGTCKPAMSFPADFHYWEAGPVVDVSTFPAATTKTFSTGRLVDSRYVDANGAPVWQSDISLFDSDLKTTCSPGPTKDAGTRCVPAVTVGMSDLLYSDAACSKPAMSVTPPCNGPGGPYFAMIGATYPGDLYSLGEPIPKTAYSKLTGTCMAWSLQPGEELRPATLLPGTALAAVTKTTDP